MSFALIRARWALITIASCVLARARRRRTPSRRRTHGLRSRRSAFTDSFRSTTAPAIPLTKDGFRLRKSDLKFDGDVSPKLKWRVTFDAGKLLTLNTKVAEVGDSVALSDAAIDQKSKLLQDAALTYFVNKELQLRHRAADHPDEPRRDDPDVEGRDDRAHAVHQRTVARRVASATCATSACRRTDSR